MDSDFSLVFRGLLLPVDLVTHFETIDLIDDKASLQRGLATCTHYCMGCHSLSYQRYERTASDLGINTDVMVQTLCHLIRKLVI